MRNSSKDLSVFEFKPDERNGDDKLAKYHFLEAFTSGYHQLKDPDISVLPPNNLHEVDSPERSTSDRNVVSTEEISELDDVKSCSTSYYAHTQTCTNDFRIGSLLQENSLVMEASRILVGSAYDDEDSVLRSSELPVNLMSIEEESCTSTSEVSSTTGALTDGHPECQVFEHCHSTCEETDDSKSTVVVCPDYVTYRDSLFLESQLTFSSECIKIVCSDANIPNEELVLVCDISDVMRIGCQWSRSVGALLFKFWIRKDTGYDPEKFVASVTDMFWLEKELKIKSLAARYEDIWDTLPDSSCALVDDMFRTHISFSKRYFTEVLEQFEDVIYPKGDPDAVSISKRDIELLEPDTFINDTIIDFYIKYLQVKVQPIEKLRFHFFNCFFFRKLADLDKDPESISEGRAAYQRVRKWTRKLNIFEKDYLFIPVNFSLHWSLLVICHPGEIVTFKDDDLMNSPKVPCILHMDSLKGNHKGLGKLIRSYLLEEWKGRHSECPDDVESRFSNLRFVHLELPQQENSSDCGLFLLHYVELFLEEAPLAFSPTNITKLSNFLSADWFPPSEASFKRFHIRGLIYDLLRDSSQNSIPTSSNEDFPCFTNDADQAVEFLSAQENPSKPVSGSTLMLPPTAQGVVFEQTSHFNSRGETCYLEEHVDGNADATEHLDGDGGADDSAECLIPMGNPSFQIFSTSFYEARPISDQVVEVVAYPSPIKSNDEPATSNERDDARKLASPIVFGFPSVPDTPDISNQKLEEFAENSQEAATGDILEEVQKHVDSQQPSPAAEDQCGSTETRSGSDTQAGCEEEHEKAEPQNYGGVGEINGDHLAGNFDGGDLEMKDCEEIGEVADSQENIVFGEYRISHRGSAATTEVILLDNDVTPPKRSKISSSAQRTSKRRKLEQRDVGPRVTRSSARKTRS